MLYVKAFAALLIVAFGVDAAAFDGEYRRSCAYSFNKVVAHVKSLHWTGFLGR